MNFISTFFKYALCLVSLQLSAQITFSKVLQDSNQGNPLSASRIISAPRNGCLIAGAAGNQGLLIRLDSIGNLLWNKTLGPGITYYDLVANYDTTYYVAAGQQSPGLNTPLLIKLNAHGGIIWTMSLQVPGYQDLTPLAIGLTNDSGLVVCGSALQTSTATAKYSFVSTFNKNGSMNWCETIATGTVSTTYRSVKQMPDSGYIMTGTLDNTVASLLKLTKTGAVAWCKSYTGNNTATVYGMDIVVQNSNLFGYFYNIIPMWIQADLSGNLITTKKYNANFNVGSSGYKLKTTLDSGFLLTGNTPDYSVLIKTDPGGNGQWISSSSMKNADAVQLADQGFILAGNGPLIAVKGAGFGQPQIGVLKLDTQGNGPCTHESATTSSSVSLSVAAVNCTATLIGSAQSLSLVPNSLLISEKNGCVDVIGGIETYAVTDRCIVYPNPGSGKINISWQNTPGLSLTYSIYDLKGQLVKEERTEKSEQIHVIDCSALAPSVYLLKITSSKGLQQSKRLIITP